MRFRPRTGSQPEPKRQPKRSGKTVVEFAMVAPVLFMMILGMMELGRGFMVLELLAASARVGARAGMVAGKTGSDVSTAVTSYLTSVGLSGSDATVYVNGTAVGGGGADPLANVTSGTDIRVQVTIPVAKVSWVPTSSWLKGNLSGYFEARAD